MLQQISDLIARRVQDQITAAVESYKAANPTKTEAEIEDFRKVVSLNISSSAAKTKLLNSKSLRKERKRLADSIINDAGFWVAKFNLQDLPPLPKAPERVTLQALQALTKVVAKALEAHRNPITVSAAVKYILNKDKKYELLATFTFLNPKDEADDLIALETLAERIQDQQFLRVSATEKDIFDGIAGRRLESLARTFRAEYLLDSTTEVEIPVKTSIQDIQHILGAKAAEALAD